MAALELTRCEQAAKHPRELEHLWHVGLPVQQRAVGIEPACEPGRCNVSDVSAQCISFAYRRERVIIRDEV